MSSPGSLPPKDWPRKSLLLHFLCFGNSKTRRKLPAVLCYHTLGPVRTRNMRFCYSFLGGRRCQIGTQQRQQRTYLFRSSSPCVCSEGGRPRGGCRIAKNMVCLTDGNMPECFFCSKCAFYPYTSPSPRLKSRFTGQSMLVSAERKDSVRR